MNRNYILTTLVIVSLASCKASDYRSAEELDARKGDYLTSGRQNIQAATKPVDGSTAQNSLDVVGNYQGTTPCADCEGIQTTVQLMDSTYKTTLVYQGKSTKAFEQAGSWKWLNGSTIELQDAKNPVKYFVGENKLIQLDASGNKVTGDLAAKYVLAKIK